ALVVRFAGALGLDEARTAQLETAALLHDIGKIGVPDAILRKAGPLEPAEYDKVKEHVVLGVRILSAIPRQEILPWIEAHHERFDGTGYPQGLAGEEIPLEARMIALCDAYDSMITMRAYRDAHSERIARARVMQGAGSQFDPVLAALLVEMLETGSLARHSTHLPNASPAFGGS
ncbi:MAG: HD domain-containing protein, partial [Coriobacteriales bacterium]|nr:HD domain-containing protein [Coriobacteriales bacterium]